MWSAFDFCDLRTGYVHSVGQIHLSESQMFPKWKQLHHDLGAAVHSRKFRVYGCAVVRQLIKPISFFNH